MQIIRHKQRKHNSESSLRCQETNQKKRGKKRWKNNDYKYHISTR